MIVIMRSPRVTVGIEFLRRQQEQDHGSDTGDQIMHRWLGHRYFLPTQNPETRPSRFWCVPHENRRDDLTVPEP